MRKFLFTVFALILVFSLTACGGSKTSSSKPSSDSNGGNGSSGKVVTLRMSWWGSQSRNDQTKQIIDLFEKKYPNIKIEPEFTGWDGYFDKMAAEAAGNNLPDIMQQDFGEYLNQYAGKDLLTDLTSYVKDGEINVDGVSDTIMASGKVNGKLLGIPTGTNALVDFYNEDMFKKAGLADPSDTWTWNDYVKDSEAIAKATGKYGTRLLDPSITFPYYLRTKGLKLFNADGTDLGYKDDQVLVDYFNMNKKLIKDKAAPGYDVINQIKGIEDELIVKGTAAQDIRWSNQAGAIIQSATDKNIKAAILPGPNNDQGMYLKPAMLWSIPKNSKHKKEAAEFINFFLNNIGVYKIGGTDRGVPLKQTIRDQMAPSLNPTDKMVFDYISKVSNNSSPIDTNYPANSSEVLDQLTSIDQKVQYGQETPEQGAKEFRQQAESILKK